VVQGSFDSADFFASEEICCAQDDNVTEHCAQDDNITQHCAKDDNLT
jgi:hypothetical protein